MCDLLHFRTGFFAVGAGLERNLEVFSLPNGSDRRVSQSGESGADGLALRIEHSGLHRYVHASNHLYPFYRPGELPWARTALKTLKTTAAILFWTSVWLTAAEPQLKQRDPLPLNGVAAYRVDQGQRMPVKFLNTVSTRGAAEGDKLYLQTVFPVAVSGRIVIPTGSYIDAEVIGVHRAGRKRGHAELEVRLGRVTLPNGTERQLNASGWLRAAVTRRGPDLLLVPGTTTDIVLRDPIVFPIEEVRSR